LNWTIQNKNRDVKRLPRTLYRSIKRALTIDVKREFAKGTDAVFSFLF